MSQHLHRQMTQMQNIYCRKCFTIFLLSTSFFHAPFLNLFVDLSTCSMHLQLIISRSGSFQVVNLINL